MSKFYSSQLPTKIHAASEIFNNNYVGKQLLKENTAFRKQFDKNLDFAFRSIKNDNAWNTCEIIAILGIVFALTAAAVYGGIKISQGGEERDQDSREDNGNLEERVNDLENRTVLIQNITYHLQNSTTENITNIYNYINNLTGDHLYDFVADWASLNRTNVDPREINATIDLVNSAIENYTRELTQAGIDIATINDRVTILNQYNKFLSENISAAESILDNKSIEDLTEEEIIELGQIKSDLNNLTDEATAYLTDFAPNIQSDDNTLSGTIGRLKIWSHLLKQYRKDFDAYTKNHVDKTRDKEFYTARINASNRLKDVEFTIKSLNANFSQYVTNLGNLENRLENAESLIETEIDIPEPDVPVLTDNTDYNITKGDDTSDKISTVEDIWPTVTGEVNVVSQETFKNWYANLTGAEQNMTWDYNQYIAKIQDVKEVETYVPREYNKDNLYGILIRFGDDSYISSEFDIDESIGMDTRIEELAEA